LEENKLAVRREFWKRDDFFVPACLSAKGEEKQIRCKDGPKGCVRHFHPAILAPITISHTTHNITQPSHNVEPWPPPPSVLPHDETNMNMMPL
jgi:hypothetical protein